MLIFEIFNFSGEAHSLLSGYINEENFRIWGGENVHMKNETPINTQKVTEWRALRLDDVIGLSLKC